MLLAKSEVFMAVLLTASVAVGQEPLEPASPVRVIFDTDMGNDVDDVLALAMLHSLESLGECRLMAVTVSKDCPLAASFVDAVNHFYGRGQLPVGLVRSGVTQEPGKFLQLASSMGGQPARFPNRFAEGQPAPDALRVLRRTLAAQPDGSVVVVQVGFSTNLARLLSTPGDAESELAGYDLVASKVRQLQVMAGNFEGVESAQRPPAEYNIAQDIPSAQRLFSDWPTPIVFSGYEVGRDITYPAQSILRDYGYVPHHPVAEAYQRYNPPPHNRPTWDLTSVLQAVRPHGGYFDLSARGRVTVDDNGISRFQAAPGGRHRYLIARRDQTQRVRQTFCELASRPPGETLCTE